MAESVLVSVADHIAHVELNRPDKRNGMDLAMFESLVAVGERLASDRSVRVVVLSAKGKSFCAGLDWASILTQGEAAAARLLERNPLKSPANLAQRACWVWQELPVPVIAAVRGAAFGAGLQLALAADLRLIASDAQMSVMEIKFGLVPDMCATQTLARLVRPDVLAELIFTGRIVSADEAIAIGLASRKSEDPEGDAHAMARTIASLSPSAVRAGKRLFAEARSLAVAEALQLEAEVQMSLLGGRNQQEAVRSVFEKRTGNFEDS